MRRGFTLIELLVVIAIIAILAAILFPVFARAREKARQSSCLSNLKQIGIATLSYIQDFDETLPLCAFAATPNYTWTPAIAPYMKNWNILVCPSRKGQNDSEAAVLTGLNATAVKGQYPHYGLNDSIDGSRLADITMPAETVMQGESNWYTASDATNQTYGRNAIAAPTYDTVSVPERGAGYWIHPHNSGRNMGFVDGHGKWVGRPNDQNLRWVP